MRLPSPFRQFGTCWLLFGYTVALHVLDEAGNHFLSVYTPNAIAIRRAVPFLPIPLFTFESWIGSLLIGLAIWLALVPLAYRGSKILKWLALPIAILAGVTNGLAHIVSSIFLRRFMPGLFSALLVLFSGILLLKSALTDREATAGSLSAT